MSPTLPVCIPPYTQRLFLLRIGPELAALNFSGSIIAWGLLIPLLIFFLGPQLQNYLPPVVLEPLARNTDSMVSRSGGVGAILAS